MTLTAETPVPATADIPLQVSSTDAELRSWRRGVGRAIASGAELFTGYAPSLVHLPLPVQRLCVVEVRIRASRQTSVVGTTSLPKVEAALLLAVQHLALPDVEVRVSHRSDVPSAVGMASATTDVTAALRALTAALGLPESALPMASIATQAGAPGGLMHPGLALVDEDSTPLRSWERFPRYAVAMVHAPATPKKDLTVLKTLAPQSTMLLAELDQAMASSDSTLLAELSTRSARLCHSVLPHALFAEVLDLEPYLEASGFTPLGYAIAHDREALCLLYPDGFEHRIRAREALHFIQEAIPHSRTGVSLTARSL